MHGRDDESVSFKAMTDRRPPRGNGPKRLQMADIARLAGVSTATVSRALNNSPLVTDETRTRIAELARSLNYTINVDAKNLRLRQNRTIAMVVPYDPAARQRVSDPFFLSMLGSVADVLTERGYALLLSRVEAADLQSAAQLYDSGRAVGVIVVGQWRQHAVLDALADRGVPLVVWGGQLPAQRYCTVGCDNVAGGDMATDHLLLSGRRRIAFFGDVELPEVALRRSGYRQALVRHGVDANPALELHASFLPDGARAAVDRLLASGEPFDAIFACSDVMAMTAIGALQERGLKVPQDVAVVGYDDVPMASYFHPPLTTIRQAIDAGGRALVDALLEQVDSGSIPASRIVATELVIRGSS